MKGETNGVDLLNGLDLFSGIGGISQALAPWVRTVAYCERERYAQAVLLSRMERGEIHTAPIWDDVTTLKKEMLPRIDFISGGFPCQDLSSAGLRKGLAGKRSGLFFEIIRLACELQPQFIFLENVSGIFRGDSLGAVGGALATAGYDCRWGALSALDVGAPHQRERWFCLAHTGSKRLSRSGLAHSPTNIRGEGQAPKKRSRGFLLSQMDGPFKGTRSRPIKTTWNGEPDIQRVAYGIPSQRHRIKSIGNGVVPQQVEEAFKRLAGLNLKGNQ